VALESASVDSSTVSKASKRERQRLNREARREYEEKVAKRHRTWKTARWVGIVAAPIIIVLVVVSVTSGGGSGSAGAVTCQSVKTPPAKTVHLTAPTGGLRPGATYRASIQTTCGPIPVTLDAQRYPKAVNNFVSLANQGFYDNLAFVRAVKDFVVQAGSPDQTNRTANTGPGYTVQAETPTARAGQATYPVGTVAFAKTGPQPAGSAESQLFIVTGSNGTKLPADYAIIGQVGSSGLAVVKKIGSFAPSSGDGPPTTTVVIKTVKITSGSNSSTPTT
jgi:cyclophilin family peptidyl-prolyl cis-trans isomerase